MQINPTEVQWDDGPQPAGAAHQPAAAAPAAPTDIQWDDAPAASAPVSAAPSAEQATKGPEAQGFTADEKQQILDYLPKAKDAADLEQFSSQLTNGRAKIGNADDVLAKYGQGHRGFGWEKPTVDNSAPLPVDKPGIREHIGEGILNMLDTLAPGVGMLLRTHQGAGKAFTEHAANGAAGDYGPEVGGFLDTVASPSQYGDFSANLDRNVAHERAQLSGDSEGHGVASALGELTGAGLVAPVAGSAVDGLAEVPSIAKTAAGSAVLGSGAGGPDHRVAGAVTGAALGAATDVAAPYVIKAVKAGGSALAAAAARGPSATPEAIAAAKAAQDLGVSLPKYALNDVDRAKAGAIEAKPFGFPIRQGANQMIDTSRDARDAIASTVGASADNVDAMGTQAQSAAASASKANRARIGNVYDQAKAAAGNLPVWAQQTRATLQNVINNEGQALGGTRAGAVVQSVLDGLNAKGGIVTIDGARLTRSELRSRLRDEAGATPDNADRITNMVMDSLGQDIKNGLTAAGREDAIPLYQQADKQWAQQLSNEDDVLKPYLGKDFDAWGSDVAQRINADVKANGPRLAQFLASMPEDAANDARATLLSRLGRSTEANQNASSDAFSLGKFLTDYNKINGSRKLIFSPETNSALEKLATIAEQAKASEKFVNRSNSGRVVASMMMSGPADAGVLGAFASGEPKIAVLGLLGSGLMAARQYGAAKLLANPDFAARLAKTPLNPQAAGAFWSRPWVNAMAAKNPAIAGEIQLFQRAVNDNLQRIPAAASVKSNGPGQNQKTNSAKP